MRRLISALLVLSLASACAARRDVEAPTATVRPVGEAATATGEAAPVEGVAQDQDESGTAIILGSIAAVVVVGLIVAAAIAGDSSAEFSSNP